MNPLSNAKAASITNVHVNPIHVTSGNTKGAIVRPIVYRKLAAAKYCPRISSGANLDTKLSCNPTVANSPNVKIAIASKEYPKVRCHREYQHRNRV